MTKKIPALSGQILDEAAAWFVEFNEGTVIHGSREKFVEWLKTSPEHVRAYLQITAHWEEARALPRASVPSIDDLVAMAREPRNAKVIEIPLGRNGEAGREPATEAALLAQTLAPVAGHSQRRFLIAAGVAALMVGTGALYWFQYERGVYSTDIGEQRSVQLADGSMVELNARSKIRVDMHVRERDVELIEGQALFRVAKDHSRPFIVRSGATNVLAVGTQFDVYKHQSGTTVTVVEGRVAVFPTTLSPNGVALEMSPMPRESVSDNTPDSVGSPRVKVDTSAQGSAKIVGLPERGDTAANTEIFLGAGEQLTVSSNAMAKSAHADIAAATAWIQKRIVFDNTPLSEVVTEFNRYNTREMVITDASIADTKISGEFSSTNPDSLLKGLNGLKKFNIHETSRRIEISGQ